MELIFETGSSASAMPRGARLAGPRRAPARAPVYRLGTGVTTSRFHYRSCAPFLETLPDGVYRAKGIVHVEEMPSYRYVLQMVGKRYHLDETGPWGLEPPRSDIVMIGSRDGINDDQLQRAFDACVGTGDETQSPILRLARRLGLDALTQNPPEDGDLPNPTIGRGTKDR